MKILIAQADLELSVTIPAKAGIQVGWAWGAIFSKESEIAASLPERRLF
jgi:hypothetical protein